MDTQNLQAALGDAIAQVLQTVEPGIVTKWVMLAETVTVDGERGLWTMCSTGSKPWDTIGMLQYSIQFEQAKMLDKE